uniref:Integrase catalytic domain-containing protein n=1 Tax=Tanacetum cinerariifolium TaxID=118510 RepID=A0A699H1H6_TANCI|nr:hypothetical protein [Tanacetum cinerariifolium]
MAPTTRTIANTSANNEPVTRQYVEDALAQLREMIVGLGAQNNHGARQANQFSRLAKVEFSKLYREDVMGWIFICDQFFLIDNTPEEERVKIIHVHLFDKALLWHRQMIKSKGDNVSWTEYKDVITLWFGSVYDDLMAALKNVKYDKSAKEYQDVFDNLLCRVKKIEKVEVMGGAELMMLSIYPNTGLQLMSMEQAEPTKATFEPKLQEKKWLPKLTGFDYEVVYKKGTDNAAVDALSRREDTILASLLKGETKKHYALHNGQLLRKEKLVVGNNESLRIDLLAHFHNDAIGGHSRKCKPDLSAYPSLLQPLHIPKTLWTSISMDFIEVLPKSHGYTVIFVVVDKLAKYRHFIPMAHPFTAVQVAQVFLNHVCNLHGVLESIVSDRDMVFLIIFWKEMFKLLHVKLLLSISYHPQIDGQTEVVNRCLEGYLRCMTGEHPKGWVK